MAINEDLILYYDLETTGNQEPDEIIEAGMVMLDSHTLDELGSFTVVIEPSQEAFNRIYVNKVVKEMHTVNGLLDDLLNGAGVPVTEADDQIYEWISTFSRNGNHIPNGGSGVAHFDRPYVNRYLPRFSKRITYWALDIGAVRRIFTVAGAKTLDSLDDKTHRALADARVHSDELRYYVSRARLADANEDVADGET